jgi:hypothetical protein
VTVRIDGEDYVTAEEAAGILNTTQLRVLMLVKEQALVGRQVEGIWYISRPSLACAEAHGTDQHAAKGCQTYCSSSGCGCK